MIRVVNCMCGGARCAGKQVLVFDDAHRAEAVSFIPWADGGGAVVAVIVNDGTQPPFVVGGVGGTFDEWRRAIDTAEQATVEGQAAADLRQLDGDA